MPANIYYYLSDILYKASTETGISTTTETADNIITGNSKLKDVLEATDNTSVLSSYIMDIIYILVVLVIALAFLTAMMYLYRFLKRRRDPYYKKNDDNFLDN
jgi:beta-lactamase regulating signal transducer with metallopeptidase domain